MPTLEQLRGLTNYTMKHLFLIIGFISFGFATIAQDLEPKGKIKEPKGFGDNMHNAFVMGRLKKATAQRDSLNELAIRYQKDTTQRGIRYRELDSTHRYWLGRYDALNTKYKGLEGDYNEMNDKYTQLIQSSLSRTEQLNLALKQKSELLLERERKLAELEAKLRKQDSITQALNNTIKRALLGFDSDEITVEMKNGKVYVSMSDKLLFKSGSANVEDKGKEAIKKLADILNKNGDVSIMIEGHTDNVPIKTAQFADNWDLSVARATNIVRLLDETYKVDAKRLTAAGRGEYMPRAKNETSEGRAKNRRTEIILSPKLDELYNLVGW